jgi:hypothetical protein
LLLLLLFTDFLDFLGKGFLGYTKSHMQKKSLKISCEFIVDQCTYKSRAKIRFLVNVFQDSEAFRCGFSLAIKFMSRFSYYLLTWYYSIFISNAFNKFMYLNALVFGIFVSIFYLTARLLLKPICFIIKVVTWFSKK